MSILDEFVTECRRLANGPNPETTIAEATRALVADPAAAAAACPPLDPSKSKVGEDVTLFADETVTIMAMVTPPGTDQPPHDHSMTAIIGICAGGEAHRLYRPERDGDDTLTAAPSGERTIRAGETLVLGPDAIHAIAADGDEPCIAVHTYLGHLPSVDRNLFHPETLAPEPLTDEAYAAYCRPWEGS